MASVRPSVVVLGAGVSGLTTALVLARSQQFRVGVVAKYVPGDYSIDYASPWAGANYAPVSKANTREAQWDADTWVEFEKLVRTTPGAGVHFQKLIHYLKHPEESPGKDPWFKDIVPNFRHIPKAECPPGYELGISYTSVVLNVPIYCAWLQSQCLEHGVIFERRVVKHIEEAFRLPRLMSGDSQSSKRSADLLVNCTGLGAKTLGGVMDQAMIPVRGQTLLVRNSPSGQTVECSTIDDSKSEEMMYIFERAAGGGTILGGCSQVGKTDPRPDPKLTENIKRRAVQFCPALTDGQGPEALDVVEARVGLRPVRQGGTRVEKEKINLADGGTGRVVHNYGHGGFGYQCSWGCSKETVDLVGEALAEA